MDKTYTHKKGTKNKYMKISGAIPSREIYGLFFPNHTFNNFPQFLLRVKDYYNNKGYYM